MSLDELLERYTLEVFREQYKRETLEKDDIKIEEWFEIRSILGRLCFGFKQLNPQPTIEEMSTLKIDSITY